MTGGADMVLKQYKKSYSERPLVSWSKGKLNYIFKTYRRL